MILLLEVALRIYNPFHFRVKGDHVILESDRKYTIDNSNIPPLDKTIVHTKNKLGFRGPEKPADFDDRLTVIAIGGSTTECQYLDDRKTWMNILSNKLQVDYPNIWMNNAGIGGHSSFGHIAMIKEHIISLRPKYVLLLVGANDIRRTKMHAASASAFISLAEKSELVNVGLNILRNILRTKEAKSKNLTDTYIDLKQADSLRLSEEQIGDYLKNESEWVDACLPGIGRDPVTDVSLETIKIRANGNGKLWWTMLERYNEGTRLVANQRNTPLIDLARLLPKSSKYFYDVVHFTNEGAEKTAEILYDSLRLLLRSPR